MLVLYKPQGMLVYRDNDLPKSPDCVSEIFKRTQKRAFPVHRLDKDTSGLIVVALDATTASQLTRWFRNQRVQKKYLALVTGILKPASGTIQLPLLQKKSKIKEAARTDYQTLKSNTAKGLSLIECRPFTGRNHQIRRHLKMLNCAILGDPIYGIETKNAGLCLSSVELTFAHPRTRKMLSFKCEPHSEMKKIIHSSFSSHPDESKIE